MLNLYSYVLQSESNVRSILLAIFFLFSWNFSSLIAEEMPRPVKVRLVSDVSSVKPDQTFSIGVLFEIEPGWHIYWRNPGDSGLPTKVDLELPDGFKADEIQWPIPIHFTREGEILDYGYKDSVLLWANIKAPIHIENKNSIKVRGMASWVSCREICLLGHADLDIELPIDSNKTERNKELFSKWDNKLPIQNSSLTKPFVSEINYSSIKENDIEYEILLDWNFDVDNIELFPMPEDALNIKSIKYENGNNTSKILLTLSIFPGQKLTSKTLDSLIVYTDENGQKNGVDFPITLNHLEKSKNI